MEEDAELDGNGTDSSEVDGDVGDVTPGMGVGRADAERRQFAAGFRTKVLVLVLSRALYQGHQQGSPQCKCQAGQPKENASGLGTGTYSGTVAAADAPSPVHPAAKWLTGLDARLSTDMRRNDIIRMYQTGKLEQPQKHLVVNVISRDAVRTLCTDLVFQLFASSMAKTGLGGELRRNSPSQLSCFFALLVFMLSVARVLMRGLADARTALTIFLAVAIAIASIALRRCWPAAVSEAKRCFRRRKCCQVGPRITGPILESMKCTACVARRAGSRRLF